MTNLLNVTSITPVSMFRGQPTSTTTDQLLYTVPTGKTARLQSIVVVNTSTSAVTLTVSIVPPGGSAATTNRLIPAASFQGSDMVSFEWAVVMNDGDRIYAKQSLSGALTLHVSGDEYSDA